MIRPFASLPAALLLATACQIGGRTPEPVTPQRPTFSVDAQTTAEGTAEIEAGVAVDPGDSLAFPTTLKWGASPNTELLAGWSPYQRVFRSGNDPDGIGDLLVGAKHRFHEATEELPAAAVQVFTKLPTAPTNGLGTGEVDFFAALTATQTFADLTATAFYQFGVVGQPGAADTELEHGFAAAVGIPLGNPRFSLLGEASLRLRPETDVELAELLGAVAYAVHDGMVLDAGISVGLTEETPDAVLLFGFTHNFGAVAPGQP